MTASTTAIAMPLLTSGRKKKWSYTSLCFSLFFFVPMFFSDPLSATDILQNLFIYSLFVGTYLLAINTRLSRVPLALAALVAVSIFGTSINAGGIVFFGFVSFILGYYYAPRLGISASLLIALSVLITLTLNYDSREIMIAAIANMIVLYGFGLMERNETLAQLKEQQHNVSLQKLSAITERERIGRDLHDIAGHALSSISLKAQVAAKYLEKGKTEDAKQEVLALATLSQELLSEIRQTVTQIKQLGLDDEINKAAAKLRSAGFDVNVEIDNAAIGSLSAWQETQISLLVKEATTNVLRHSEGDTVNLVISAQDGKIWFRCTDNGTSPDFREGNGLTGMRERLDSLNGELSVDTKQGFALLASMPVQPTTEARS